MGENLMANLATSADVKEEKDVLGGGMFGTVDSDFYKCKIKYAYISKSAGEAVALNIHATTEDGKNVTQQFWMTSGKAKGCKNFYIDKAGDKQYLPGFNQANAISLLTTGKEIAALVPEKKVINLYNFKLKAEEPTPVDMLMDMVGKDVGFGIIKQKVNQKEKDPATGAYVPRRNEAGELLYRYENEIDKIFRARDGLTVLEIKAGQTVPDFQTKWLNKWKGVEKDATDKDDGKGAKAGAPLPTGAAVQPDALFV